MNPQIYAKSAPPWKSGGSNVERWESGLIRVTQEYLCPTAQRDSITDGFQVGSELEGIASPASDGLYVFPAPNSQDMNDGFSKISVSAYGRIAGVSSLSMVYSQVTITVSGTPLVFLVPNYRVLWVTKSGEPPIPDEFNLLLTRDPIYRLNMGQFTVSTYPRKMTYTPSPSTGFGEMQEQVYNVEITPRDADFVGGTIETGGPVVIVDPPIVYPPIVDPPA